MLYKIKPDYVYIVVFALFVVGGPVRYGVEKLFTMDNPEVSQVRHLQE